MGREEKIQERKEEKMISIQWSEVKWGELIGMEQGGTGLDKRRDKIR